MKAVDTFADIQALVNAEIKLLNETIKTQLKSDVVLINQISHYIIDNGGKRLRPLLLILMAKSLNYQGKHHITLAAVIELIHTATLLHDDVVDESVLRRGKQTAHTRWGNAASVLVGDFIYSRAFEMMVQPKKIAVMSVLAKTTNAIAQGEVMQLLHSKNIHLTERDYYQMIERKTACLFQATAQLACLLGEHKASNLADYGLYLGLAFQVIDDVLDYTATNEHIGKTIGDDLREGKMTLPLIYAFKKANQSEKTALKKIINKTNINASDLATTIDIIKKYQAFEYGQKKAAQLIDKATQSLTNLTSSPYKDALTLLAKLSINRQS